MSRIVEPPRNELDSLRQPLTAGERLVFDQLDRELDEAWEIYLQPHLNGTRPDFVLLNPTVGIVVIEVKDWNFDAMHYFVKTRDNGHAELYARKGDEEFAIPNPFSRIKEYKEAIFNIYCPRLPEKAGFGTITPLVIFPFAPRDQILELQKRFLNDKEQENRETWLPVAGKEDMMAGGLKRRIPLLKREGQTVMRPYHAADMRKWLVEPDFAKTQREPLVMDSNQRTMTNTRTPSGYRRIKGPAGSGKSVVLAGRAARLASEGKSVLIVSFNITLWHYLHDMIVRGLRDLVVNGRSVSKPMSGVTFTHFHGWSKQVCQHRRIEHLGFLDRYSKIMKPIAEIQNNPSLDPKEKKRRISAISGPILNDQVPRLAGEAARALSQFEQFDAVLVDEGQDLLPQWWDALRKICRTDGEMVLVADVTQDVYGTAGNWTEEVMSGAGFKGPWAQLKVGYRVPSAALGLARDFATRYLPAESRDLPERDQASLELDESSVRWIQCSEQEAVAKCTYAVHQMKYNVKDNSTSNSDIVFLCDSIDHGQKVVDQLETYTGYKHNIAHTYEHDKAKEGRLKMAFWMGQPRIKATTFHSFKGWETRLLVVYIASIREYKNCTAIYAALTRLKRHPAGSHIIVVCSEPRLAEFGRRYNEMVS
ncbi:NERD domain-containing protein [Sphingomonas sp. NPDC019816]|uniref:NERD domain-containing protein n=1 Tax=Sphingomonas sp. NPDC019816 TaxID=3390679 RepID=UPI003CFC883D